MAHAEVKELASCSQPVLKMLLALAKIAEGFNTDSVNGNIEIHFNQGMPMKISEKKYHTMQEASRG